MLDATRLRVLVAVARHGSVTAAAQALNYAQPSISHHMARLEAETGAKLMERSGRGVRLTDAGQLLAGRAEEILGRLDAAEAELAAHIGQRASRVRLAAFRAAIGILVPAAAAALRCDPDGPELELAEADPDEAERMLRSGLADVALTFAYRRAGADPPAGGDPAGDPGPADDSEPATDEQPADQAEFGDLHRKLVLDESVYLITPADLADGGDPRLDDLWEQRWITGHDRDRQFLIDHCGGAGFTPEIAFSTDDCAAAQNLVAAGFGVAMLPGLAMRSGKHPELRATVLTGARYRVYAVTYGTPPDPPHCAQLISALLRSASAAVPVTPG